MKNIIMLLAFAALLAGCDKNSMNSNTTDQNRPMATVTNLPGTNAPAVP